MSEPARLRIPVRALWSFPLGAAAIALGEAWMQAPNQGPGAATMVLATLAGAATGVWLSAIAVVLVLVSSRLQRVDGWLGRLDAALATPAPGLAAAAFLAAVAAAAVPPLVDTVLEVSAAHPVDYLQTRASLWVAGVLALAPVVAAAVYGLGRAAEARMRPSAATRWVLRLAVSILAALCLAHLVSGPFFVYFGAPAAAALLALASLAAALWLPRRSSPRAAVLAAHLVGLFGVLALALVGLRSPSTRALLLHDTRVFPHLFQWAAAGFDADGDGSHPTWLGGGDCDDRDDARSSWRVELPDNGIDEDCVGGDLVAPAPTRARAAADSPRRPPIFLVTIDTLRLDRTSLGGYERETMPALVRFAAQGREYSQARAPANHTFYSMVALLAGQHAERMLVAGDLADPGDSGVEAGPGQIRFSEWLPHELRRAGYATVAFNPPLVLDGKLPGAQLRFDHLEVGRFDYAGKNRGTTARQVVDDVLRILSQDDRAKPIFAWVHFMDPHAAHEAPARFAGGEERDDYDNELSWVDLHLQRLLEFIDEKYGEEAIVVLTSDHGEEFGERGSWGHGFSLMDSELRVPLLLRGPGVEPGRDEREVSTVAVAPTLLELAGLSVPPGMSQPSLLRDGAEGSLSANPAYLWNELRMEVAYVRGGWKIVHGRVRDTWLLYDLRADPGERDNLVAAEPERFAQMQEALAEALAQERALVSERPVGDERAQVDKAGER